MESLSIAVGETASSAAAQLSDSLTQASPYFNRELSWLEFNRRVLEEALDERHPLLERVKFLSIFSTNLDEFFMIRVAGIKQQVAAGVVSRSPDGMTPAEQLAAVRRVVSAQQDMQRKCWLQDMQPELRDQGIRLLDYHELTKQQRALCTAYFEREVFPVLTPLAFDPSHPFPQISNLSINLAVVINDPEEGELFARVKVPAVLPHLIPIEAGRHARPAHIPPERRHCFVWLEQVIAENVDALFPGMEVVEAYVFRITRNADMEIQEEEAAQALSFSRRAEFVQGVLVNGAAGIESWLPGGRPLAVMGFTVRHDKIVAIDILADPTRLRQLDLALLDHLRSAPGPRRGMQLCSRDTHTRRRSGHAARRMP